MSDRAGRDRRRRPEPEEDPDIGDVFDQLEELAETVDSEEERRRVEEAMRTASEASRTEAPFGRVIWGFDRADASEALLGSILFGIPMAVEGGTQEVAEFFVQQPGFLVGTLGFTVALTAGVLYVAEFQDVRVRDRVLGLVPRRLVGVLGVSLITAAVMLTAWGRVDWASPALAAASVAVAFLPMSIGAALGDILPGS